MKRKKSKRASRAENKPEIDAQGDTAKRLRLLRMQIGEKHKQEVIDRPTDISSKPPSRPAKGSGEWAAKIFDERADESEKARESFAQTVNEHEAMPQPAKFDRRRGRLLARAALEGRAEFDRVWERLNGSGQNRERSGEAASSESSNAEQRLGEKGGETVHETKEEYNLRMQQMMRSMREEMSFRKLDQKSTMAQRLGSFTASTETKSWVDALSKVGPRIEARTAEARLHIAATQRQISSGELQFRDRANQFTFQLDDYAALAAAKMTRKSFTQPQGTDELITEFGDAIRPHLKDIWNRADLLIQRELVILREPNGTASATPATTEQPTMQSQPPKVQSKPPRVKSSGPATPAVKSTASRPPAAAVNLAQRVVLIAGFVVVLGMALFPPWLYVYRHPKVPQAERPAGYHLIFGQHTPKPEMALGWFFGVPPNEADLRFFSLQIDRTRLAVEIGATLTLVVILYLALRSAKG